MHFAIMGAGGVGGYFGGLLARSGANVTFVARGAHLDAIRERGLEVRGPEGSFQVSPAQATDSGDSVGEADVVFVALKTWQLEASLPAIKPMVGAQTVIVPLLNGVEAPAILAAAFGADRVLGVICNVMSYVSSPGVIEHLGAATSLTLGEISGVTSDRVERVAAVLRAANITVVVPEDITAALWKKFAFIASFGGVGAATRAPAGVVRSVEVTRALLERAVSEVVNVARARGVALTEDQVERTMAYVDQLPAAGTASMARDLASGRRSELDAWNGAVVRIGKEVGVATPVHDFIYASLLPTELRARGSCAY